MVFRRTPSASLGDLLPAVQQRLLMEVVLDLADRLIEDDSQTKHDIKDSLSIQQQEQQRYRHQIDYILLPLEQDNKFVSSSSNQEFQIMKTFSTFTVLSGTLVRASMNKYTKNLNYGTTTTIVSSLQNPNDVYTVTDPIWKKAYIRANDGLPSVDKVMAADLDLRDLYRNQVQQKLDDASAEWYSPHCDLDEFRSLVKEAATSFDLWLDRISEKDVKDAIQAAFERKELPLHEPFSAAFFPNLSLSL
jgi:hypothetical protein